MLLRLLKWMNVMFITLKNFLKKKTTFVIVCKLVVLFPCTKNVVYTRITQNPCHSFSKKWIWHQEPFCVFLQKTSVSELTKIYTEHVFNTCLRHLRFKRSKKPLLIYSKNLFKKILCLNEKIFTIEQKFNEQNDKVYMLGHHTRTKQKFPKFKKITHTSLWSGGKCRGMGLLQFFSACQE